MKSKFQKIFIILVLTILSSISSNAMDIIKRQVISVQHPFIRYTGRIDFTEGKTAIMAYPAISIEMKFKGSEIGFKGAVITGEATYFNACLDDRVLERIVLKAGDFDHTIATGLDPEEIHTLRLVRRNEAWQGIVEIKSFMGDIHLQLEALPAPPERKILCIGDSITCGEQTEYLPPYGVPGIHNSNGEIAYGSLLAKHFDAQIHLVSCGGRGLIRTWDGKIPPEDVNAPLFFERTLPDDPAKLWDHSQYQPDLVTICLGTNDFNQDIIDEEIYVAAYAKFVHRILEVHPKAKVLLISGPIFGLEEPKREILENYIKKAAETVNEELGKTKVNIHLIGYYPGSIWNGHPTAPQHEAMTRELIPVVEEWMHWK